MERTERMRLIKEIEAARDSKLLVFVAGDREGMPARIANDIFPTLHTHLRHICGTDRLKRIDLFLYSIGGLTMAGYSLVNLFREFCEEFNVIIPFKAHSTATLIALGAKEIVMTRMGQLSPIDPSVTHALGPIVDLPGQQQQQLVPLNVEDVNGFVDLACKEFKLESEEAMSKVFEILAGQVNAVALGAVQRAREEIVFLATRLLEYHDKDEEHVKQVVDLLTRERFSHGYIIGRTEAKETLKLRIVEPDEQLTNTIMSLYGCYTEITMMDRPYNPEQLLGQSTSTTEDFNSAVIESADRTHVYRQRKQIKRVPLSKQKGLPPQVGYQEQLLQREWIADNNI